MKNAAFVGIDLGTSGCRAIAMDTDARPIADAAVTLPQPDRTDGGKSEQAPEVWWQAVCRVLAQLKTGLGSHRIQGIAVDGTSSSLLICDAAGTPLAPALMYDDTRARGFLPRIREHAPADTAVHAASSSLAKGLYLSATTNVGNAALLLHQSDWIMGRLSGRYGVSDENNALKLGYDALQGRWPEWLSDCGLPDNLLPRVYRPGTPIGTLAPGLARQLGLASTIPIMAGTTDSTAAALATGVAKPGQAVTSLGSTLVVKVLARRPVFSAVYGVYSHRLGDLWLVGGASNSGGSVLERYFSRPDMAAMTQALDPDRTSGLDYYPLLRPGERFPINDPDYPPRLEPRPENPVRFFQGLLEGIAHVEQLGYRRLELLGAPSPCCVFTIGGGSENDAWRQIRQRQLQVPVIKAAVQQAAYGCALLAARGG